MAKKYKGSIKVPLIDTVIQCCLETDTAKSSQNIVLPAIPICLVKLGEYPLSKIGFGKSLSRVTNQ